MQQGGSSIGSSAMPGGLALQCSPCQGWISSSDPCRSAELWTPVPPFCRSIRGKCSPSSPVRLSRLLPRSSPTRERGRSLTAAPLPVPTLFLSPTHLLAVHIPSPLRLPAADNLPHVCTHKGAWGNGLACIQAPAPAASLAHVEAWRAALRDLRAAGRPLLLHTLVAAVQPGGAVLGVALDLGEKGAVMESVQRPRQRSG